MPTGEIPRRSRGHLPSGAPTPTSVDPHFLYSHDVSCWSLLRSNRLLPKLTTAIVLLIATTTADGTCNEEQIDTCRESALDGRLVLLKSGGQCSPRRYAEFSHLCSVTNYLPNVEYCCCIYETNVLCCRYHQDWNLFRCQMEEDVIDTTSGIIDHLGEEDNEWSLCCPPLEFLLPAILVPFFVVVCCLYVCLKYWKHCGADSICSSSHVDDTVNGISTRKNRKSNDCVDLGDPSSLTSSDGNRILPLTSNGQVLTAIEKMGVYYPPSISPGATNAPGDHNTSPFDDESSCFPGVHHHLYLPSVEPSAPPLFDTQDQPPCAFHHLEPSDQNCEEYCGTRYRDVGGRLRPLYRASRGNFSSSGGGRCSGVPGPLVHRTNTGGGQRICRPLKHDRCATYRMTGYQTSTCSVSPPPPSYEQSCNHNS